MNNIQFCCLLSCIWLSPVPLSSGSWAPNIIIAVMYMLAAFVICTYETFKK